MRLFLSQMNCIPTFQSPTETGGFNIYFLDVKVGTIELEDRVWTGRDMKGEKVAQCTGAWWNSANAMVDKAYYEYAKEHGYPTMHAKIQELTKKITAGELR